jgi:hypothetical protein
LSFLICFGNTFVPITIIKFFKNQNIMKKQSTCYLAIFLMLLSLFAGCEKGLFEKKVKIRGQIPKGRSESTAGAKLNGRGFTLDDAQKVLIFYGREYDLVTIKKDGSFQGKAPFGSPTAIVFLTDKDEFIGHLVTGGINFLPLPTSASNLSVIDLSTLTLDGEHVIPANDPVGSSIILSAEEIAFMQEVGSYYKALAKNLDMNNDGTPDILQNGHIDCNTDQGFKAGVFGLNVQVPSILPASTFALNYGIHMVGPNNLLSSTANSLAENAILAGPLDSPYTDIYNAGNSYINTKEFKLNFARGGNQGVFLPFRDGEYMLSIDNKPFTFHYSNINMLKYWVLVVPTLHTDAQNKVTHITLTYQFPDGTPVNPRTLIRSGIDLNITGMSYQQALELLTEEDAHTDPSYDFTRIDLPNPINISDVRTVQLLYFDLFGNRSGNSWQFE